MTGENNQDLEAFSDAFGWKDQDGNELRLFREWPEDLSSIIKGQFAGHNWDVIRAEISCSEKPDSEISIEEAEEMTKALFERGVFTDVGALGSDKLTAVYDFLEEGEEPMLTPLPHSITNASNPLRQACKIDRSIPMS